MYILKYIYYILMYSTGYNKLNFIMYTKSYMYIIVFSAMKSLWQIRGWTSKLLGKDKFLYQFSWRTLLIGSPSAGAPPCLPCHLVTIHFFPQCSWGQLTDFRTTRNKENLLNSRETLVFQTSELMVLTFHTHWKKGNRDALNSGKVVWLFNVVGRETKAPVLLPGDEGIWGAL